MVLTFLVLWDFPKEHSLMKEEKNSGSVHSADSVLKNDLTVPCLSITYLHLVVK